MPTNHSLPGHLIKTLGLSGSESTDLCFNTGYRTSLDFCHLSLRSTVSFVCVSFLSIFPLLGQHLGRLYEHPPFDILILKAQALRPAQCFQPAPPRRSAKFPEAAAADDSRHSPAGLSRTWVWHSTRASPVIEAASRNRSFHTSPSQQKPDRRVCSRRLAMATEA